MNHCEPVFHCLQSEVEQSRVADSLDVVQLPEDAEKRLMVEADGEVGKAQNEKLALVKAVNRGEGLSLNGMVSGFCSRVELAPAVYCLPASFAAARSVSWAQAAFLCEPEPDPKFGPICGKGRGEFGVKQFYPLFTLSNDLLLRFLEGFLELWGPLEGHFGLEEMAKWFHCRSDGEGVGYLVDGPKP